MKFPERMVLSNADREMVLPLLERALVGKHLCGIHFYFTPIVLVNYPDAPSDNSEAYITIESAWRREETLRGDWPNTEADLPEQSVAHLATAAAELRPYRIRAISLGTTAAHLRLEFENDAGLLLSGNNPRFESWQVGTPNLLVVAAPGGGLTWWSADNSHLLPPNER